MLAGTDVPGSQNEKNVLLLVEKLLLCGLIYSFDFDLWVTLSDFGGEWGQRTHINTLREYNTCCE